MIRLFGICASTRAVVAVVDENDSHEALFAPSAGGNKKHFQFPR